MNYVNRVQKTVANIQNVRLLQVKQFPEGDRRNSYPLMHKNPVLICETIEESNTTTIKRFLLILQNEWQGYGTQTWEGIQELKQATPCIIASMQVISNGKLPGSTSLFDQCDLSIQIQQEIEGKANDEQQTIVISPKAWSSDYPLQQLIHIVEEKSVAIMESMLVEI